MRAEFACDPVKIAVGRFVTFHISRFVEVSAFKRIVPSAFEYLKGFCNQLGAVCAKRAVDQRKKAVFHFFFRSVAGEAQPHRFAEVLFPVGNKVKRNGFLAQYVLRGVGIVSAFQNHGVIIFARHVVGEAERICAEVGFSVFRNSSRKNGRHGKKGGSLVKVIYNS